MQTDRYKVSINKQYRDENGNVIERKNWIVTAFDKTKKKGEKKNTPSRETLTTPSSNLNKADGVTLPSNGGISSDKDNVSSSEKQVDEPKKEGERIPVVKGGTINDTTDPLNSVEPRMAKASEVEKVSREEQALRDALVDKLKESGIDVVTDSEAAQRVLDEANGKIKLSAKQKRALETASVSQKENHQQTAISSADGANILKKLDELSEEYDKDSYTKEKLSLVMLQRH